MINRIEQNISDYKKSISEIEDFITGTVLSYSFFVNKYPDLEKEFVEKGRSKEEKEGMEMFKKLNEEIPNYESDIYTIGLVNLIARTEAFLNDILESLFLWRKKSLIADKSISYKEVIECDNIEDLIEKIRTKEILEFSHASFKDKINFLKKKFNLSFPIIEKRMPEIIELFTTRNIVLHNNGIVNETYLNVNKKSEFELGTKRVVDRHYLKLTFVLLIMIARSIEESVKEKMEKASH